MASSIPKTIPFVGRYYEFSLLNDLLSKKRASLVVINGRRRVGKSSLIKEFARGHKFYEFIGLAPSEGVSAQDQRNAFALSLSQQTGLPEIVVDDWSKLFALLFDQTKPGRMIVLLDEITWMADGDNTFLSKLKSAWDMYHKKNPKLMLILCGSVSAWIEKNIIHSTAFFGRISLHFTLNKLPLTQCADLLDQIGFKRSLYEKLMVLSVVGGIPWYIEQIKPIYSAADNIKKLCFDKDGLLVREYKYIFHDLFGRRSEIYQKIVRLLAAGGAMDYNDISEQLNYSKGSVLTDYLHELVLCGYVSQQNAWSMKSGKPGKIVQYRLSDNYLRFYFKYIEPKLNMILKGRFADVDVTGLPGWWSLMGLQFENMVLGNRELIFIKLNIPAREIVSDDPYVQRATKAMKGCQIDYLIQTKLNTLFVCEIKFSRHTIGLEVVHAVQEKIAKLAIPKNFAIMPILIHASAVSDEVIDADYFHSVINFCDFL
jgi:AAA+ ATPase superfamily predicted ATPase